MNKKTNTSRILTSREFKEMLKKRKAETKGTTVRLTEYLRGKVTGFTKVDQWVD